MKKAKAELHILVVDDHPDSREMAVEYLQTLGYGQVSVVNDGAEAIQFLEEDPSVDMVLSDWDMPQIDGISLLKKVRAHPDLQHLAFVIMASPRSIEQDRVSMAVKDLVDDYIIKPFKLQTLQDKLDKALSTSVHGPQKTVVLADDDPDSRAMVIEYLQRFGFKKVKAFEDGSAALEYLKRNASDVWLVIADWEMPKMKGVELLSYCRASKTLKEIPFFIITSQISMERMKIVEAAKSHVDKYLLKPFTKEDLQDRIEEILHRRRIHRTVTETVDKGLKSLERGHYKMALKTFQKALKLDPEFDTCLSGLGDVVSKLQSLEAAIPYYQKAVTVNPARDTHYLKLANAYEQLQQTGKALKILQVALNYLSGNATIRLEMALLYQKLDAPTKAIRELNIVLQLEPHNQRAGTLLTELKEIERRRPKKQIGKLPRKP